MSVGGLVQGGAQSEGTLAGQVRSHTHTHTHTHTHLPVLTVVYVCGGTCPGGCPGRRYTCWAGQVTHSHTHTHLYSQWDMSVGGLVQGGAQGKGTLAGQVRAPPLTEGACAVSSFDVRHTATGQDFHWKEETQRYVYVSTCVCRHVAYYLLTYAHRSRWSIGHLRPLAIALCSELLWPFQTSWSRAVSALLQWCSLCTGAYMPMHTCGCKSMGKLAIWVWAILLLCLYIYLMHHRLTQSECSNS